MHYSSFLLKHCGVYNSCLRAHDVKWRQTRKQTVSQPVEQRRLLHPENMRKRYLRFILCYLQFIFLSSFLQTNSKHRHRAQFCYVNRHFEFGIVWMQKRQRRRKWKAGMHVCWRFWLLPPTCFSGKESSSNTNSVMMQKFQPTSRKVNVCNSGHGAYMVIKVEPNMECIKYNKNVNENAIQAKIINKYEQLSW